MEIKESLCQLPLRVSDEAHVDAARRAIVRLAGQVTDDEALIGRLTVVVQEMARNLVRHAVGGELYCSYNAGRLGVVAVDSGPGMTNIAQCLADNYSTTGTMGAGLGAIRRLSDHFDLYSRPGQGTVIYSQFTLADGPTSGFTAGALCTPYPGEDVCGDSWAVNGNRLLVCDGLGHGHAASKASQLARDVFLQHNPSLSLEVLIEQLHRAMTATRGGALAIAEIQPEQGQVQFCGIGNIAGYLVNGRARSMVSNNGTVGYRIGRIQSFSYPWEPSSLLVMSSDGISTKFDLSASPGLQLRHPAVIAAWVHRDFKRHNDDATVVVMKRD